MLFSATMTDEVESLAAVSLSKPVRLFVDSNRDVAFNLRQEFIRIRPDKEIDREPILAALVCRTFREHCMVFVQTKKQAHRLHILLGNLFLFMYDNKLQIMDIVQIQHHVTFWKIIYLVQKKLNCVKFKFRNGRYYTY